MSVKIDVSEIKTFRTCRRQWQLSSRNRFHMRPRVTPKAFSLGIIFHESLHSLYLNVAPEKVMEMVRREMSVEDDAALLAMIPGYVREVLYQDLERYQVLDIEHRFSFLPTDSNGELILDDVEIVGSIDMIALEVATGKIFGFEHKTCKSFREKAYLWMDEQPRVYTKALEHYVANYNKVHGTDYTVGGVYINEVKKLLRDFKYQRTLCEYPVEDMDNFMHAFFGSCAACKHAIDTNDIAPPMPSYFSCQMCNYSTICETYMYRRLDEAQVLEEFKEEFEKRREDHLDEKVERLVEK